MFPLREARVTLEPSYDLIDRTFELVDIRHFLGTSIDSDLKGFPLLKCFDETVQDAPYARLCFILKRHITYVF